MRRLGAALGVEAMSLYNHVPNKASLLDGIVEVVVGEIEIPPAQEHWTERLKTMARSFREMALRHPNFVPLLATRPFGATPVLRPVEAVFEALSAAGLDDKEAVDAYRVLAAFALGYTMTEVAGAFPSQESSGSFGIQEAPIEEYPNLARVAPYLFKGDPAEQFEHGLEALIKGLVAARYA